MDQIKIASETVIRGTLLG